MNTRSFLGMAGTILVTMQLLLGAAMVQPEAYSGPSSEAKQAEKSIQELIEQLGSTDFAKREAATRELMSREEAEQALRKALQSPDPEVVRRASLILESYKPRRTQRWLARLAALGKNGEVDQLIEQAVEHESGEKDVAWGQPVLDCLSKIVEAGNIEKRVFNTKDYGISDVMAVRSFERYLRTTNPEVLSTGKLQGRPQTGYVIRTRQIHFSESCFTSLVLCTGPADLEETSSVGYSVILGGDNVQINDGISSILICDGSFKAAQRLRGCLVVARGTVQFEDAKHSVIVSGSTVHSKYALREADEVSITENEPHPFGFVKWFEPENVGLAMRQVDGSWRIAEGAGSKVLTQSGLRPEDMILAVDDTEIKTAEAYRRLVRRKLAEGKDMVFHVRRLNKPLEITVKAAP
jgi:hypothetical protein